MFFIIGLFLVIAGLLFTFGIAQQYGKMQSAPPEVRWAAFLAIVIGFLLIVGSILLFIWRTLP